MPRRNGFDQVYVLGLGPENDPTDAADRVADLLGDHHYAPGGIALLPVDTPTTLSRSRRRIP